MSYFTGFIFVIVKLYSAWIKRKLIYQARSVIIKKSLFSNASCQIKVYLLNHQSGLISVSVCVEVSTVEETSETDVVCVEVSIVSGGAV